MPNVPIEDVAGTVKDLIRAAVALNLEGKNKPKSRHQRSSGKLGS